MDFTALTGEALVEALALDIAAATNEDLTAALADRSTAFKALRAVTEPTMATAEDATAVLSSIREIKAAQKERDDKAKEAEKNFAEAVAEFDSLTEEESDEDETEEPEVEEVEEEVEASAETTEDEPDEVEETVTAAADPTRSTKIARPGFARKAVGQKTTRPSVKASPEVIITAAADIPNVRMGEHLSDMNAVAAATVARAGNFAPYNEAAAHAAYEASGGQPVLTKVPVASFLTPHDETMVASGRGGDLNKDYNAVKAAVDSHKERVLANMRADLTGQHDTPEAITAAGWCSPSEIVYNWIADFVVDGLLDGPSIAAPRGGLMLTEGPQLLQTTYAGDAVDDFGFGGTETEAIAGNFNKTCETIECPDFVDYRLDYDGYCWKIPILTESSFPELVADAMRVSDVAYAHKINRRKINDIIGLSGGVKPVDGYGPSFGDTLEALTQIAIKERRWWNIGENAVMEVKLPQFVRDVFKFDMGRRSGLALSDIATDQRIAAHFANHNLSVSYLSDMQDLSGPAEPTPSWDATFKAIIYPAGTFVFAEKPVINLSAVYDAASLSENEYTGVFFEQGLKTIKRGYRSTVLEIPVCTSGETGANSLDCSMAPIGSN